MDTSIGLEEFQNMDRKGMYAHLKRVNPTLAVGHTRSDRTTLSDIYVEHLMVALKAQRNTPKVKVVVTSRRGSPEAIEKRRVARQLNSALTAGIPSKVDGRTKRRIESLTKLTKKEGLKPAKHLLTLKALYEIDPALLGNAKPLRISFAQGTKEEGTKCLEKLGELHNFDWSKLGKAFVVSAAKA